MARYLNYANIVTGDGRHYTGDGPACSKCNSCAKFYSKNGHYGCMSSSNASAAAEAWEGKVPSGCRIYEQGAPSGGHSSADRFEGKSGAMAGLGQMASSLSSEGNASDSMNALLGGAGKVAAGLASAAIAAAKAEAEASRLRRAQDLRERIGKAVFGDAHQTAKGIDRLFGVFNEAFEYSNDSMHLQDRQAVADQCLAKIEEGVGLYKGDPEKDAKKSDAYQLKLQKYKVKRLEIKRDPGLFESEDKNTAAYNKNLVVIEGVSFDGGEKLIVKNLDALFKTGASMFSFLGAAKELDGDDKRKLTDAAVRKIRTGIEAYRNEDGADPKKLAGYEEDLEKLLINRNSIKAPSGDDYTFNAAATIVNCVSFDGGSKVTACGMDSLFRVCDSMFGIGGAGKKFTALEKHRLCGEAVQKIRQGLELLKADAAFDAKKLAGYEEDLEKLLINRNSIKAPSGDEFTASAAKSLMACVSFEGGSKAVAAGLDTISGLCGSMFGLMGGGKKFDSSDKRALCAAAIPQFKLGLARLKEDDAFDAKKLAGYEADLEKLLANRNSIRPGPDEDYDEFAAQAVIDNVFIEGGAAAVAEGIDTLFSVKDALFSFMGKGKDIFSEPKRAICDSAIGKIEQGIGALKNDPSFDGKKLAKYETELVEFREKREGIQKSNAEIQAEKKAEQNEKMKQQAEIQAEKKAEQNEKMKQQLADAGSQLKNAFGGMGKGLGGLNPFGKKEDAKNETAEDSGEKQDKGGILGGLGDFGKMGKGLGGLNPFGKKEDAKNETVEDSGEKQDKGGILGGLSGLGKMGKGLGGGLNPFGKKK